MNKVVNRLQALAELSASDSSTTKADFIRFLNDNVCSNYT